MIFLVQTVEGRSCWSFLSPFCSSPEVVRCTQSTLAANTCVYIGKLLSSEFWSPVTLTFEVYHSPRSGLGFAFCLTEELSALCWNRDILKGSCTVSGEFDVKPGQCWGCWKGAFLQGYRAATRQKCLPWGCYCCCEGSAEARKASS